MANGAVARSSGHGWRVRDHDNALDETMICRLLSTTAYIQTWASSRKCARKGLTGCCERALLPFSNTPDPVHARIRQPPARHLQSLTDDEIYFSRPSSLFFEQPVQDGRVHTIHEPFMRRTWLEYAREQVSRRPEEGDGL